MKITDRIKKIHKSIGYNLTFDTAMEEFKQLGPTGEILSIDIKNVYDIDVIVKFKGEVNLPLVNDIFTLDHIRRLPLVKKKGNRRWFHSYPTDCPQAKNIFFTEKDYSSSALHECNLEIIKELKEELRKLNININIQSKAVPYIIKEKIIEVYGVSEEQAEKLNELGLSPLGWKNIQEDFFYSENIIGNQMKYEFNRNLIKRKELVLNIGILEITKERNNKRK